jgi:hypothetical protein
MILLILPSIVYVLIKYVVAAVSDKSARSFSCCTEDRWALKPLTIIVNVQQQWYSFYDRIGFFTSVASPLLLLMLLTSHTKLKVII